MALSGPSPELCDLVASLADAAVSHTEEQLYSRFPLELARFGEQGRKACRQDLRYHLDFLRAALVCGEVAPFRDYATWLAEVLKSRSVPTHHLSESFRLLDNFFREQLPQTCAPISAVLLEGIAALSHPASLTVFNTPLPETNKPAHGYLLALLENDRRGAERLALAHQHSVGNLTDVGVDIIQPALYEVGRLWQLNRITVAQEHLASAISQNVMARLFAQAEFAMPLERGALFACVPGSHHSLGLRMVSDAFEVAGWDVRFLGADTPTDALIQQVDSWHPEIVGLSLSLPRHIEVTRQTIAQLRAEFGTRCPALLVGGQPTNQVRGLWKTLDADLWGANARDSLREAHG